MKVPGRFIVLVVSFTLISFLIIACNKQASEKNKKAVNEAYTDLQTEKQDFEKEMDKKVVTLNRELGEMKSKAGTATGKTKVELQAQVDELEKNLNVAQDKLKNVKNASAQNWKEMKSDVETAFDDLGKSFAQAMERFK
ncbi:hypothetical protein JW960_16860 [candidate division KSB1 bacterium]|nr:hypothetical protein [candidate division KSB1 bacterium]